MDEEVSIINTNTRNEKIKNFLINNKNKLIFGIIILLVGIVGIYSFDKYQINKKQRVSDTFNLVTIEYSENNKEKTITNLIEIINEKDPTYSPLSLYFIIDNELISDQKQINELFDILIDQTSLDDEIKLCKRYNVSKSVVREAVKILVAKGLLEVRRGNGTRVRQRASWNLLDDDVLAWHQGVEPETDFLRKLIDVRLMVEPNAAFWAAGAATNEQIKEISKSHNDMENAKSIEEFVVADAKFHRAVLRAANNELLTAMEGVIFSALLSSIKITNNDPIDNRERSLPLHYKILKAIETQNKERAEFAMRKHMADTYERLSKLLPELKSGVKKM